MKGFVSIITVIGIAILAVVVGIFVTRLPQNLGAANTELTDTLNTFRANVNTLNSEYHASTSTDPGHIHTTFASTTITNASTTNISATGYGLFPSLFFTTATGTTLTITGVASTSQLYINSSTVSSLRDVSGNKFSTSTPLYPIQWIVINETSSMKDAVFIFNNTSTISSVRAGNNTSGTVTFNLGFATSTLNATSTWRKLFTSDQTVSSVTSTNLTVNGSTTPSTNDFLGYYTVAASSTEFTVSIFYQTP